MSEGWGAQGGLGTGLVALGDRWAGGGTHNPRVCAGHCGCPPCCGRSSRAASPGAHGMVLVSVASHRVPPAHGRQAPLCSARCPPPRSPLRPAPAHPGGDGVGGGWVVGKAEPQAGNVLRGRGGGHTHTLGASRISPSVCGTGPTRVGFKPWRDAPPLQERRWCWEEVPPFPSSAVAVLGVRGSPGNAGEGAVAPSEAPTGMRGCKPLALLTPQWLWMLPLPASPTGAEPTALKSFPPPAQLRAWTGLSCPIDEDRGPWPQ